MAVLSTENNFELRQELLKKNPNVFGLTSIFFQTTVFGIDNTFESLIEFQNVLMAVQPKQIMFFVPEGEFENKYLRKAAISSFEDSMDLIKSQLINRSDKGYKLLSFLKRAVQPRPCHFVGDPPQQKERL